MANPEDLAASAAASQPSAAMPGDAATPAESAKIEPAKIEPANIEPQPAAGEAAKISYLQPYTAAAAESGAATEASRPGRSRYALAASIALAAALGALAGAAATNAITGESAPPASVAVANANRSLQDGMTRMESELATLRTGIATAQRTTGAQIGKLAERIDRAEKAQAEPAAKLAKMMESLDRLEHRLPQPQAAAPAVHSDITGSVTAKQEAKQESKPAPAEGWRLVDLYDGRAVVENRNGRAFEVMPGSNLPGLGRVETIKREDGRVVVVTRNGIIAAAVEPRRRPPVYYRD